MVFTASCFKMWCFSFLSISCHQHNNSLLEIFTKTSNCIPVPAKCFTDIRDVVSTSKHHYCLSLLTFTESWYNCDAKIWNQMCLYSHDMQIIKKVTEQVLTDMCITYRQHMQMVKITYFLFDWTLSRPCQKFYASVIANTAAVLKNSIPLHEVELELELKSECTLPFANKCSKVLFSVHAILHYSTPAMPLVKMFRPWRLLLVKRP